MATFQFQTQQGTFEVEAPDQKTAIQAFQGMGQPSAADQASERAKAGIARAQSGAPRLQVDPNTGQPAGVPAFSPRSYSAGSSAAMGAADMAGLGWADEGAAGLGYLLDKLPGGQGRGYSQILGDINNDQDAAFNQHRDAYRTGEGAAIATQLLGGPLVNALRGTSSAAANAAARAPSLGQMALNGGKIGAGMGLVSGAGNGRDLTSRAIGAGVGGVTGGVIGLAAPYAATILDTALSPVVAPIMSRFRPESYTDAALGKVLSRSGMTADEVANRLSAAQADDQGMFNVADAIGNSAQRVLSTAARNPHDGRQGLIDALQQRQMGQGERLINFLAEGFDAPDTAAQRAASLASARQAAADVNYGAARQGAGPVNLNDTVGKIDALLHRDPIMGDSALSQGPLGSRLSALRDQLKKGGEQLIDFNRVLNIKSDLYNAMQANPRVANDMRPVYSELDKALEGASSAYRNANDSYRIASGVVDAVDIGKGMASGRTRSADNIPRFNALTPAQQSAARVGYVDPYIAKVESSSISPTTNKARALMTEKTGAEFPAFAAPGRADQMGTRIAREQRMFETANTALGGSKTADNLADAADLNKFDPSIMTHLAGGRIMPAIAAGITKALSAGSGMPPTVLNRLSQILMETDPAAARALLSTGANKNISEASRRAIYSAVLSRLGGQAVITATTGN